jgi:hypothetical protein
MNEMRTNKSGFEIETCGRCGGSGRYSFNLQDGDRCYGCGGKGVKRTKRGQAAYDFFCAGIKVPWAEIEVGDKIHQDGWRTVTAIAADPYNSGRIAVELGANFGINTTTTATTFVLRKRDQALADAIAYQDTLTKSGKPRKVKETQ